MLGDIPIFRLIGMAAGALILFIGIFVLRAKPDSRLHQLFFALAVADGISTFAFNLAQSPVHEFVRLHAFLVYYYGFMAFLALLVAFGASFPRPAIPQRYLPHAGIGLAVILLGFMIVHALRYEAFWVPTRRGGELGFQLTDGGRILAMAFVATTAFIILRATSILRTETSASHRLQGALVLGGMAIGYAPFATTTVLDGINRGFAVSYFASNPTVALTYWAAAFTLLAVLVSAALVFLESRDDRRLERRVALLCLGAVLVVTLPSAISPSRETAASLRSLALLFYPLFLGYAIARYEVLDIDAQVRRAATASMIGAGFTAAFLLFEVFLEGILQDVLSFGISAQVAAGVVAALLTAAISIPLARVARKAAGKISPILGPDDIQVRKREIYRHALHGAAMDGIIAPHELRVLQRLRESLQISEDEHNAISREVGLTA